MIAVIIETSYDNVNVIQEILADAKVLNWTELKWILLNTLTAKMLNN